MTSYDVENCKIHVLCDDITNLPFKVDVIVNAANERLLGGGGVDGAIHRAAGIGLVQECEKIKVKSSGNRCDCGQIEVTQPHGLSDKCSYIFHAVAPRYKMLSDKNHAQSLLKSCYTMSINVAESLKCKAIAFPCLGTGIFEYPFYEASNVALEAIIKATNYCNDFEIYLVCFTPEDAEMMNKIVASYAN